MLAKLEPYRRLLLNAAAVMSERGRCVGALGDNDGRVCLAAALNIAASGRQDAQGVEFDYKGLSEAYKAIEDHLGMDVVTWNDQVARSDAEVIDMLNGLALGQ